MRCRLTTMLVLAVTWPAWAEPPTTGEIVKATKPSVALIEKDFGQTKVNAAAFVVAPGGYFATALHALPLQFAGAKVKLILHPGDVGQTEVEATVVRTDNDFDLALLKVEKSEFPPALALGLADPPEKAELILFAFPTPRRVEKADYSPVSVATAVTGLPRTDSGRVRVIPKGMVVGTAGAPALDTAGKVAGMMSDGLLMIPITRLRRFVERPEITLTAPAVESKERHEPKGYAVKLAFDPPMTEKVTVELAVRTAAGERRFPMKAVGDKFEGSAAAFDKDATATVQVELKYADGAVRLPLADRMVITKAGERRLSEISRITFGKDPMAELADGTRAEGEVTGLDGLVASVGGQKLTASTAHAREMIITPPAGSGDGYLLTVVASVGRREVGRKEAMRYVGEADPPPLAALKQGNFAKPREALARRTYVILLPIAGEPVGIAKRREYDAKNFRMEPLPSGNQDLLKVVFATLDGPAAGRFPSGIGDGLQFISPSGQRMAAGDYPRAVTTLTLLDDGAAMNVWTDKPIGNLDPLGHFVVHEYELRGDKVTAFAADFLWQPDRTAKAMLAGVIRYNSSFE